MPVSVPGNSCRCGCVAPASGCLFILPGTCVQYTSSNIIGPGINTGDTFNTAIVKLSTYAVNCCAGQANLDIEYDSTGICTDSFDINPLVTVTLVGQTGQGAYFFILDSVGTGTFPLPPTLSGNFKPYASGKSADFIRVTLRNSSNSTLTTFQISNTTNYGSGAVFDIAQLDNVLFGCTSAE